MIKFHLPALTLAALVGAATLTAQDKPDPAKPNAQMQAILDELAGLNGKPIENLEAEEARHQPSPTIAVVKMMGELGLKPEPVGHVDALPNIELEGRKLNARIYRPDGDGPFPIILYIHGGGWVIADIDTYDASGRALSNAANAVVVAIEYRKAPEHKFPAAHDDSIGAYEWVTKNADKVHGDRNRIAVVGESAGGNMANAVSMAAKEKGWPLPVHQVLVYPVADLTDLDAPSHVQFADAKPLNKPMIEWFGKQLLSDPALVSDPRLSPAKGGDKLKGLPPTTIINAEIDPLKSDGDKLAAALQAAGVSVTHKVYAGVTHEFFGMGALLNEAKEAQGLAGTELKAAFAK
jgi:acetyl esterase